MTDQPAGRRRTCALASLGILLSFVLVAWGIGDSIRGRAGGSLMIALGAAEFVLVGLLVAIAVRRGRL